MFTQDQIKELVSIVDYHNSFLVATVLGKDSLNDYDKFILKQNGIDIDRLALENPSYFQMYLWGKLSAQLSETQGKNLDYENFKKHVQRGQYIPLSKEETNRYNISKQRTYNHLKGISEKQKQNILTIVSNELSKGVEERKTLKSIISEIGHKTGDWNRDWGRIVDTEYNNIFQQGRAETISLKRGKQALVFKDVYAGACRHCIKAYLTNGVGSQPIIYTLEELESNGSNLGRKVADWLPTVDGLHIFCRCTLRELPEGYEWSEESGSFKAKKYETKRTVKAILTIGDLTFEV